MVRFVTVARFVEQVTAEALGEYTKRIAARQPYNQWSTRSVEAEFARPLAMADIYSSLF